MKRKFGKLLQAFSKLVPFFLMLVLSSCATEEVRLPNIICRNIDFNWQFRQVGEAHWHSASVPGTTHTDLLSAGLIEDPFFGNNELNLQWIENENWEYRCVFEVESVLLEMSQIYICFEGLDTYATVFLNGEKIIEANNMFLPWKAQVKSLLVSGENELIVLFESPVERNIKENEKLGYRLPADNDSTFTSPFVRKAAYHFGWDWAPRLVTCGIWKPVTITAFNTAKLLDVYVEQLELTNDTAKLRAHFSIESNINQTFSFRIGGESKLFMANDGLNVDSLDFEILQPKYWEPNGSGQPYLYYLMASLGDSVQVIDNIEVRLGLRSIHLINVSDEVGTSFYFEVNGEPLFIKGANYIPQDVFLPRVKPEQYRNLLISSKEAGMNMLRVWGGGVYEQDLFYNLCDSLGILVWQDFMFAGTAYPGDAVFLKNVEQEIEYQVKRLRKHPCLALWCGNNEIDVAWNNWGWQKKYGYSAADSTAIWNNHRKLFYEIIPEIVEKHAANIAYVPTSPQSNWGKVENFNHGSMHYWGVWHGRDNYASFKNNVGRFMVEYGMQSYPNWETLSEFVASPDLALDSEVMKNRQKSYIGNGEILRQMELLNLYPKNFEEFVNMSQQSQAEALEIALNAHLNSKGHCMGTMFWQLNDCWPGPSWSVIDYNGQKKLGYYAVKDQFTK